MKKILKNTLYILLAVVGYSFPIWFIIGLIPWAYMVDFNDIMYWQFVKIQFGGLIGVLISGGAMWYKWEHNI